MALGTETHGQRINLAAGFIKPGFPQGIFNFVLPGNLGPLLVLGGGLDEVGATQAHRINAVIELQRPTLNRDPTHLEQE